MPQALDWRALFSRKMLVCVFIGFSSGMPLYVAVSLMPAWLRTEGVSLAEIGFFSLVQFPYTWKFLWAPLMDRYALPFLGLRRGWMLLTQVALIAVIGWFGFFDPRVDLVSISILAGFLAFASASQDIVLDAYRRELLSEAELGLGSSIHVNAYRVAGLVPGALALWLADWMPWRWVFLIVAAFMLISVVMTLSLRELSDPNRQPRTLREAVVEPFHEFFTRHGVQSALMILVFMFLYKLGDNMATALSTPFYIDLGFSLSEIALVAKNASLWPAVIGGMLGGLWMLKIGINRALWIFGVVQILSILGFFWLSTLGANIYALAAVLCFEYLGVGLGTAALVAYVARAAHPAYLATQLALLTALTALPRTVANAATGVMVESMGWPMFYLVCFALAMPGMLMLVKVAPWNGDQLASHTSDRDDNKDCTSSRVVER